MDAKSFGQTVIDLNGISSITMDSNMNYAFVLVFVRRDLLFSFSIVGGRKKKKSFSILCLL